MGLIFCLINKNDKMNLPNSDLSIEDNTSYESNVSTENNVASDYETLDVENEYVKLLLKKATGN